MYLLIVAGVVFIVLSFLLAHWRKNGALTPHRFALMSAAFFSFLMLALILTYTELTWQNIAFGSALAIFEFVLIYSLSLFFYKKFYA